MRRCCRRRRGAHGAGTWSPPGGHLEFGEDPMDCVTREALEEAGIRLKDLEFFGVTNDVFAEEGRHYMTLFYSAHLESGTPRVCEPRPGSEKMVSVTTAPPNSPAISTPTSVTRGMSAFLPAWRRRTSHCWSPLARAVRR
ncbi:MAG: NUDIX domain-containing protein [Chloroflexi bacterium]|nr:NUDIX domain-containing protein [Chloroflexota bacterium]